MLGCRELGPEGVAQGLAGHSGTPAGARAGRPSSDPMPNPGGAAGEPGGAESAGAAGRESEAAGEGGAREPRANDAGDSSVPLPPPESAPRIVECADPQPARECEFTGEGEDLVVSGDVLAPGVIYLGGAVRVLAAGSIGCVGCNCEDGAPARLVRCPGSVISPAFVNPHDHVAYAHQPPPAPSAERYEHRHDWRLGLRGHTAIPYEGGAPAVVRAAHELRLLLGGATTVAGGAGHRGLLRNPDLPDLGEGLPNAPADSDTFPLDDASGRLLSDSCAYGGDHTRGEDIERYGGYLPHLGEGIDAASRNELRCALTQDFDLIRSQTAVVHAVLPSAAEARELGRRHAAVVWSPRSNLVLYGNTAPVPLLLRSGVDVSLGTDWLLSGSMNVLRELACARSFSTGYFPGAIDDMNLFRMVTASAARAVGAGAALGRLAPGSLADVLVVRRRGLAPHSAVVTAGPADIELVLRGGTPLYGRAHLIEALVGPSCDAVEVCGAEQRACTAETGFGFAELRAAAEATYPLFSCDLPPNEPPCTPSRP
ncbi:MAG TPA: amidohydrolase family protein, partial [Polyangiaceae bacterium]